MLKQRVEPKSQTVPRALIKLPDMLIRCDRTESSIFQRCARPLHEARSLHAQKKKKIRTTTQSDPILIYASRSPRLAIGLVLADSAVYHRALRHYRAAHRCRARDRPTDKFTGSSGGIMRRRRSLTMGNAVRSHGAIPFPFPVLSRIIPESTSHETPPRRARPFAPSVSPFGTGKLKLLSREGRRSIYFVINSTAALVHLERAA